MLVLEITKYRKDHKLHSIFCGRSLGGYCCWPRYFPGTQSTLLSLGFLITPPLPPPTKHIYQSRGTTPGILTQQPKVYGESQYSSQGYVTYLMRSRPPSALLLPVLPSPSCHTTADIQTLDCRFIHLSYSWVTVPTPNQVVAEAAAAATRCGINRPRSTIIIIVPISPLEPTNGKEKKNFLML